MSCKYSLCYSLCYSLSYSLCYRLCYSLSHYIKDKYSGLFRKRLLNYILCIRFISKMHSIVSASQFSYTNLSQGLFLSGSLAFSRLFLHFSGTVLIIFSIHPVVVPSDLCLIWEPIIRKFAYYIIQPLSGVGTTFLTSQPLTI